MTATLIVLGALAALGVLGTYLVLSRRPPEVAFHHFRCPACGQKLRYAAEKVSRGGMCPRCKKRWSLPTLSPASSAPAGGEARQLVGRKLALRRTG